MPDQAAARGLAGRWPLVAVVAWRYVRGGRSRLLTSTSTAALVATSLGVTAMVVAMALMTGYTEDLERKLIGLQGEVIATPLAADPAAHAAALAAAARLPGVKRIGRTAYGEGSIGSEAVPEGVAVVLRGVDPADDPAVGDPARLASRDGVPAVLVGEELRRRLGATVGDVLRLVVLDLSGKAPRFRYRSARLAGTFASGFAQFDSGWAILDREVLVGIRGDSGFDVAEVQLEDPRRTQEVAARLEAVLGPDFVVSSWLSLNRDLFAALELQELLLFLVLGLIVVVSTFNVASTLVILVRERTRDVGVLAALGLGPGQLWTIFALYGLALGAAGTAIGVAIGTAISWAMTRFEVIHFGPEVAAIYFIDSVPFRVEPRDLASIVVFSLAATLVACALPALRAARLVPSDALRAE